MTASSKRFARRRARLRASVGKRGRARLRPSEGGRERRAAGRPARVVFWAGSFELAGTQRFLLSLLRGLDRSVYEPIVFSTKPEGELLPEIESLGASVHEFGTGRSPLSPRTIGGLWRAGRFLRRERVDALCCMLGITTLFGPLVGRAAGVPVVVNSQRNMGYWLRGRSRRWLYGFVSRRIVDAVLVNSRAAGEELVGRFGVDAGKVHEIPAGVDVAAFESARRDEELRRELGLENVRVVGAVGKLSRVKNHALFLRAAARVVGSRKDVAFLIVGDGPLRKDLEELAGWLGLTRRALFLGDRRDVPELLKLMDVFVMPSMSEGLPNAVMEAMAAGLPVVATDVGGVSELVVDGRTGRLVAPDDENELAEAVTSLLEAPGRAAEMGAAGHERVKAGYDVGASVVRFEDVLGGLLLAAGRGPER
ncbi:MAG: glycosyltransferase [Candidatus Eisenbacteria bacterium]|nr:glycosyltransferase [Candidatus Eisenbacteria bacterium]